MSKRDKIKFKKRIKEQILQEASRVEPVVKEKTSTPALNMSPDQPKSEIQNIVPAQDKPTDILDFVKYDLKKSAIIIGSIIVVIIIVFFIDNKTGFLLKVSDSLFRVLHIGV